MPEPSSLWPTRVLGDPRWLRTNLLIWDGSRFREPFKIAQSVWYDLHVASYLYRLIRELKPKVCVETGVHVGKSSTAILSALHRNEKGTLISIDLPKNGLWKDGDGFEDVSWVRAGETGKLVPAYLRNRWDLRLGDSKMILPKLLSRLGTIDLFFHDSEHSYAVQMFEYEEAWKYLRTGGILASDDTDRSGAWNLFLWTKEGDYEHLQDGPGAIRAVKKIG